MEKTASDLGEYSTNLPDGRKISVFLNRKYGFGRPTQTVIYAANIEDGTSFIVKALAKGVVERDPNTPSNFRQGYEYQRLLSGTGGVPFVYGVVALPSADNERYGYAGYVEQEISGDSLGLDGELGGIYPGWIMDVSPTKAVSIVADVLGTLDEVHKANIIHRDVKPSNIRLEQSMGKAYLVDFKHAVTIENAPTTEQLDDTIYKCSYGTSRYSEPRLFQPQEKATPSSDIYAMGLTLFQLLTGIPMNDFLKKYKGDDTLIDFITSARFKQKILQELWMSKRGIKDSSTNVVMKAIDADPRKRYQTAGEMRSALTA